MRNIQGDLGIHTTKKTHLNRGGAARFAEDSGASEAEIRRAGRWNVQQMQGCYLTGLPRKAMRALAGFPTKPGGYHLPRATISPPPSLITQIWPSIDLDLPKIEQGLDDFEKDLAAQGFCRLLQYLRTVLLQDAAILRKLHPDLPVLQHSLFASPIFLAYAAELEAAVEKNERPLSVSVHEVMPEVHRYLLDMQRDQQAAGLVNQSTNNVVLKLAGLVQGAFRSIMQEVEAVAEREVKVTVHVEQHQGSRLRPIATTTTAQTTAPQAGRLPPPPPLPLPPSPPLALPPPPLLLSPPTASPSPPPSPPTAPPPTSRQGRPSTEAGLDAEGAGAQAAAHGEMLRNDSESRSMSNHHDQRQLQQPLQPLPEPTQAPQQQRQQRLLELPLVAFAPPSSPAFELPVLGSSASELAATEPPHYEQSRALTTIAHVWEEYERGINGGPAVKELEAVWQHKWRADAKNRKSFSQRAKLYRLITRLAVEKRITEDAAAEALDKARRALKGSLDWCQKHPEDLMKATMPCVPRGTE
ncbi:hypothetical protein V8E36_001775 [Tilletia maclaganii]